MSRRLRTLEVTPSARRLIGSLRDIGYDFATAVADLVDNSISAGSDTVEVDLVFDGANSYLMLSDNGSGMSRPQLEEALRFGTRRSYSEGDLGRFGLGLKTASLSQCRRVTVITRRAPRRRLVTARRLDLDHVLETDRWEIYEPDAHGPTAVAIDKLEEGPGTVVLLEDLDRILSGTDPEGGWARRRLARLASETSVYLGMVFHRFIEGSPGRERLKIVVNGEKVRPWNPFAPGEEHTQVLPLQLFELSAGTGTRIVSFQPCILPPRRLFSSQSEFERLAGPRRWNRQQGLYVYRGDRLVQSGGWSGLRAADEHTKLARAALSFPIELDHVFRIDVAKMRISLPPKLRTMIERQVNELCGRADAAYRRERGGAERRREPAETTLPTRPDVRSVGLALRVAAFEAGESESFRRVVMTLRRVQPEVAATLGFDSC